MDKFCEDCIHNEVCQYGAIPPHKDRCNDKDTLDDIRLHGKWYKTGQSFINPDKFLSYCCSNCHSDLDEHIRIEPNFCPNCGADMREEEDK